MAIDTTPINFSTGRPTLPPLRSLNLPLMTSQQEGFRLPGVESFDCLIDQNQNVQPLYETMPRLRQASILSSSASSPSSSRSPSPPSDMDAESPHHPTVPVPGTGLKLRLAPCPLDEAEAVILVPPPSTPHVPTPNSPTAPADKGQALLLFGRALERVRGPDRMLAKGARVHPYRIIRGREGAIKRGLTQA